MKHVTLLFIRSNDQILLAMKKRGHGVGKWNGVGGKVEEGETFRSAAIRECIEEIGVTPHHPTPVGRLRFFDQNDPTFEHDCQIFVSTNWDGDPKETEEMRPQWFHIDSLPYKDMWPADEIWMPYLLNSDLFEGSITLDEQTVAEHHIKVVEALD